MPAAAEPVRPAVRSLYTRARLERWWQGGTRGAGRLLDLLLVPPALAYRAGAGCYHGAYDTGWIKAESVAVPVVSVGNLVVGGAGKTPVAAWLAEQLRRRGARPAILHGGYSSDEPNLHRQWQPTVPVIAERDRIAAANRAIAAGATILVLDDGFQHRRLARDLDLVLVPAERWTATPRLLPRGPWRELPHALARAHAIIVVRKTTDAETSRRVAAEVAAFAPDRAVVRLHLRPAGWRLAGAGTAEAGTRPAGPTLAVAGVGQPAAFVENARQAGARVDAALFFPDHHRYRARDLANIRRAAAGRPVVTTAKDALKLERFDAAPELWVLEQRIVLEEGTTALERILYPLVP